MPARPGRNPGAAPRRSDTGRHDQVVALLTPPVRATGLELEDVELRTVGRRLVVRVLVDSERGVSLDEVASAAHIVSELLDGSDVFGVEPYTLEVSSPGVDRPLTLPRHWRRNIGRLVALTLTDGQQVAGRITSLSDTEVELELDTKGRKSRRTVAYAGIAKALVQVEFSRAAAADLGDETDSGADDDETGLDTDTDTDPDDDTDDDLDDTES